MKTADNNARLQALNTQISCIVQAPAGSGKTELLTQRFLALLATVKQPEEIIALTFTRKAAFEMRERIIQALAAAATDTEPAQNHKRTTWRLATAALQQNEAQDWNLLNYPNRLRVQTIDSLCVNLIQQTPLLSSYSPDISITDDANYYYQLAVRQLLADVTPTHPCYDALVKLLLHLDNQQQRLENLLCQLLTCRDQWLPYLLAAKNSENLRQCLEAGLQHIVQESLAALVASIPETIREELLTLVKFAGSQIAQAKPDSAIRHCAQLRKLPGITLDDCPAWQGIATLLLTKEFTWRKTVNKTCGFPSPGSAESAAEKQYWQVMKNCMQEMLLELQSCETMRQCLQDIMQCPPPYYTDQQWSMVAALTQMLPMLAAQLSIVFNQAGVIDYIEIATRALQTLTDDEAPSDLALILDHKLQHLLVDEFQDTSIHQFQLLEQLTSGWQENDGHTLFLVGDPMQSIYRFRAAEVGLFLRAQAQGIADVELQTLTLTANFRSQEKIVRWCNDVFQPSFPQQEDLSMGAVSYTPAHAQQDNDGSTGVFYHVNSDADDEAQQLVSLVQSCQAQDKTGSIAILVRARHHLDMIFPALQAADIPCQAHDINSLSQSSVIQDLWSLTRALLFLNDRLAWLSILRAPWCGLRLADLHIIARHSRQTTILDILGQIDELPDLSEDGALRLRHIARIFIGANQHRRRQPLRTTVETIWQKLKGPLCGKDAESMNQAQAFFDLLARHEQGWDLTDCDQFAVKIDRHFAKSINTEDVHLHIMTIHKAKGLEFDTVILPGLTQSGRSNQTPLLLWSERPGIKGENDLILAPIKASDQKSDPVYQYLWYADHIKDHYEQARLLYVAATRAKKQLHLSANLATDQENDLLCQAPPKSSLLHHIWTPVKHEFIRQKKLNTKILSENTRLPLIKRLPDSWFKTKVDEAVPITMQARQIPLTQPAQTNRLCGIAIHEQLKLIGQQGLAQWPIASLQHKKVHWRHRLLSMGIIPADLDHSINLIEQALLNTLCDPHGQWILANTHRQAQCEYELTLARDGNIDSVIIDRTFIDDDNNRWIIDYKTSTCTLDNIEQFKQQEQAKHSRQLQCYAHALHLLDKRPVKFGLYYPLEPLWLSWTP